MWSLAQYNYQTTGNRGLGAVLIILYVLLIIVFVAALWKIFEKAGQKGWKAIIPIYNTVIMCRIVGLSGWYTLLLLVPIVGALFAIYLIYQLAKSFGYGFGMALLTIFGIGYLIMGFGRAKYLGPDGGQPQTAQTGQPPSPSPPAAQTPPVNPAPPAAPPV